MVPFVVAPIGDTWLFLPYLVEVWDVGCLCRETLVSRGRSSVLLASLSRWVYAEGLLPHCVALAQPCLRVVALL
ncbi:hypothetical protein Taro_050307 [Colocasia esculenta]|uniref:Uncharacterized protein n=1 Tax=Colocasia esculenta TaxID=4460 RepID=A0A843XD27_COLES|nr:hypothetical protein [Colocasia esculenta]